MRASHVVSGAAIVDGRKLSVNGPTGAARTAPAGTPARKDIFGTWLLAPTPNRSTSGPQPMIQLLTSAGQKAVAAYDPFRDDPTFRCDPVGVRRVWGAPGTPLEIVRGGRDVVLRHEWMDVRRVVHMNLKDHPAGGARSSLGHSIGRVDGDALAIETGSTDRMSDLLSSGWGRFNARRLTGRLSTPARGLRKPAARAAL